MYFQKFVAVVKCDGKILRENNGEVTIPFNSEYSIFLKNLNSQKSLVNISIDGKDVLDCNSLIVYPNSESELKGYMTGNTVRNKFKFIPKTKEISDYRGDRIDDGIIRIEYRFEMISRTFTNSYDWSILRGTGGVNKWGDSFYSTGSNLEGFYGNKGPSGCGQFSGPIGNDGICCNASFQNIDNGITVKGSETNQNFRTANIGPLEESSNVIILRLIGTDSLGKNVESPITIQTKKICKTCGKKSRSHFKFCNNCGTFLE